ncbi:MAG: hypothetical protein DMD83_06550 [Candidatus Rokuibacteriota bacterium]|nr:MAG: hypothetical protein DMD83_06550 [Candidatus Rokubacteria bacterium]
MEQPPRPEDEPGADADDDGEPVAHQRLQQGVGESRQRVARGGPQRSRHRGRRGDEERIGDPESHRGLPRERENAERQHLPAEYPEPRV